MNGSAAGFNGERGVRGASLTMSLVVIGLEWTSSGCPGEFVGSIRALELTSGQRRKG